MKVLRGLFYSLVFITCVMLQVIVGAPLVAASNGDELVVFAGSVSHSFAKISQIPTLTQHLLTSTPAPTFVVNPALVSTFGVTSTPAQGIPTETLTPTEVVLLEAEPICSSSCINWGWLTIRTDFFYKEGSYSKPQTYVEGENLGFQVDSSGNFVNGIAFDKMEFCSWDLPAENSGSCVNGGTLVFFDKENIDLEDLPYHSDGWTYVADFLENDAYLFGGHYIAIVFDGSFAAHQGEALSEAFECYAGPMILKAPEMVSALGIERLAQSAWFAVPVPGDLVSELTVIGVLLGENGDIMVNPDTKVAVLVAPHEDKSGCKNYAD
jgi:hypothetical protein